MIYTKVYKKYFDNKIKCRQALNRYNQNKNTIHPIIYELKNLKWLIALHYKYEKWDGDIVAKMMIMGG